MARKSRRCLGKTAKNTKCKFYCQGKFCWRHQKSKKPKKLKRRLKKLRRNPAEHDDLRACLEKIESGINNLCQKLECPSGCEPYCPTNLRALRRRNPWNRPLSAALARGFLGEEFEESGSYAKKLHSILIIGGDRSYVPEWLTQKFEVLQLNQIETDLEKQLGDFVPEVIIVFVKASKPFRPTRATIYQARNYAKGANYRKEEVPYITFHRGWSQALQRAGELGLDWLVDSYPFAIYVPKEELEPRPKKEMTPAKLMHNLKRAARFKEKGITHHHSNYAQIRYVTDKDSHCCLCDTKIIYQFRLLFDIPGNPEPTIFFPVGSVCITDWMESLPDTQGKLNILIQARNELMKAEEVANEKKRGGAEKRREFSQQTKKLEMERRERVAKRKEEKRQERDRKRQERDQARQREAPRDIGPQTEKKMDDLQKDFGWE